MSAPPVSSASAGVLDNFVQWFAALGQRSVQIELLAVLGVLGIALLLAFRVKRAFPGDAARLRTLRHLAFSTTALIVLELLRVSCKHLGMQTQLIAVAVQLALALWLIRLLELALRQVFARSAWLKGVERYLALTIWTLVALDLIGLLTDIIDWLESISIHAGKQHLSLWTLIQGGLTVIITVIIALWVGGLIEERLMRSEQLDTSVKAVFSRVLRAALTFLGVLIALSLVGIDFTTLSVFSGALGVGLGFGMQKIASNYISGFIILLDRSIRIGSLISVGTDRGEVLEISTRYTVLRALNGINIIVPNETLISSVVQNETFADRNVWISIKLQVSTTTDIEQALKILQECATIHERVLQTPPPQAYLANFGENGFDLELGFWLFDPLQGQLGVRSAINREILRRFRAAGIEFSSPQRELRLVDAGLTAAGLAATGV